MRSSTVGFLVAVSMGMQVTGLVLAQVTYHPGYDPAKDRPAGIPAVPEEGWTEEVSGLRAAISAPAMVRFNQRFVMHVLVQNVSQKPIKVTFPALAIHPSFTPIEEPTATGGYSNNHRFRRWEIAPGQEIAVPFPPKVIVRDGVIHPTHAVRGCQPGVHKVATGFGSEEGAWEIVPGEKDAREVVAGKGEWKGYFRLNPHRIEFLDEDVNPEYLPPAQLGNELKLDPVTARPKLPEIDVPIDYGVRIQVDGRGGRKEHWLVDSASHSSPIYWGPLSDEELKKTDLLEALRERIAGKIGEDYHRRDGLSEMAALASLPGPFVEILFDLAPLLENHRAGGETSYLLAMARELRNRRMELKELGLAERAEAALIVLTAAEPELPDPARFESVTAEPRPLDAPNEGWGPINAGLQAAALMPKTIRSGQEVEAFLFIRNSSEKPIFFTFDRVASHSGNASAVAKVSLASPSPCPGLLDHSRRRFR